MKKLVNILFLLLVLLTSIVLAKEIVIPNEGVNIIDGQENIDEVVQQEREGRIGGNEVTYYYAGSKILATDDSINGRKYYHQDRLNTNRIITDSSGNEIGRFKSLPYGQALDTSDERYSFTGKELDKDSGLYDFDARQYDADTGKFISSDPAKDENAYAYVGNNPMNLIDPSGMSSEDIAPTVVVVPDDFCGPLSDNQIYASDFLSFIIQQSIELAIQKAKAMELYDRYLQFTPSTYLSLTANRGSFDRVFPTYNDGGSGSFAEDPNYHYSTFGLSGGTEWKSLSFSLGASKSATRWDDYIDNYGGTFREETTGFNVGVGWEKDVKKLKGKFSVGVDASSENGEIFKEARTFEAAGFGTLHEDEESVADVSGNSLGASVGYSGQLFGVPLGFGAGGDLVNNDRPTNFGGESFSRTGSLRVGTERLFRSNHFKLSADYILSASSLRQPYHLLNVGAAANLWDSGFILNAGTTIPLGGTDGRSGIPISVGVKYGF